MNRIVLFFMLLSSIHSFAQVQDDFSDGDFTANPTWVGTTSNFIVWPETILQPLNQIRLNLTSTATTSYLATPSHSIKNAEWEAWFRINCSTTSGNYSCFHLTALSDAFPKSKGYYVMIGNTADEISLYRQDSISATKIIDGTDKRIDYAGFRVMVKVTRDSLGEWKLYSKLVDLYETDYVLEGSVVDNTYMTSNFTGFSCTTSASNSSKYYFDDIKISGAAYQKVIESDLTPPEIVSDTVIGLDSILITFSEPMDFSKVAFSLGPNFTSVIDTLIASDNKSVLLKLPSSLTRGINYTLSFTGLSDLAGNLLSPSSWTFSIPEIPLPPVPPVLLPSFPKPQLGDLVLNEVFFNSPEAAQEFVELYNKTDNQLDLSGLKITTRKTDGTLNTGSAISSQVTILPKGYLALCKTPSIDSLYFQSPEESSFATMSSWPSLNNDGATLVICNAAKDTIYDELTYSPKWHHPLIKNEQGVSLERINPDLPTQDSKSWHSAASQVNYATPGYKNSQYLEIDAKQDLKEFWLENENFTPNNDGNLDVLLIHYALPSTAWMANITIFDASGQIVSNLYRSYLLGSGGTLSWDGKKDDGKLANIGIYVLYIEYFNPDKGETKRIKLPCVVSGK